MLLRVKKLTKNTRILQRNHISLDIRYNDLSKTAYVKDIVVRSFFGTESEKVVRHLDGPPVLFTIK